jgi:hypothetical protein
MDRPSAIRLWTVRGRCASLTNENDPNRKVAAGWIRRLPWRDERANSTNWPLEEDMSIAIWIDVNPRREETLSDMTVLNALAKELDALAERLGVNKVSSFFDYRELIRGSGEAEKDLPAPVWFDAATGLAAFSALHKKLKSDWAALSWTPNKSQGHWPERLMENLAFCCSVLQDAVTRKEKFRLLIV